MLCYLLFGYIYAPYFALSLPKCCMLPAFWVCLHPDDFFVRPQSGLYVTYFLGMSTPTSENVNIKQPLYVTYFLGMSTPPAAMQRIQHRLYVTYFLGMSTPLYT